MNNYGIGTPLSVQWHLNKPDGTPFSLAGYTYTLKYKANRGSGIARSTNVITDDDGKLSNIIVWNFAGHEQVATGVYDLELTIYRSGKKLCQSTYLGAFSLEKHIQKFPEMIHTLQREVNMHEQQSAVVELFSAAEWWMYKPVEPVAGSDGFWYVNGSMVLDDNGDPVPTKYSVRFDPEDQCLYVYVGVYGEESYQEIQKITDVADIVAYVKNTFEENESARQALFRENEEKRQENEIKRENNYNELVTFVRSATEQIATASTPEGNWFRSDTPIRLAPDTIISIKARGSSAYALMDTSGYVIASSNGDDDLVYTTSAMSSFYVASSAQGEIIQYKLMVVANRSIQDSAMQIDDLIRLGYKAVAWSSPEAVEGETPVELKAELVGYNGTSVKADKTIFKIGNDTISENPVKLSGATRIDVSMFKGEHEYNSAIYVGGYRYIYYGVGMNAGTVMASGKTLRTSGDDPSGNYSVSASVASSHYFYFLLPAGMKTPRAFKTDGFDLPCSEVMNESVTGYIIYRSDSTISSSDDFNVTVEV